jgi:hypothetical protein
VNIIVDVAFFARIGEESIKPIIGFDDLGYALVISSREGRLVRACDVDGYCGIVVEDVKGFTTRPFGELYGEVEKKES